MTMPDSLSEHINIENLPTIPHTLLELIRLFEQPCVEFNALADAVRKDPVVTARIFNLANSVYFRQWNKTSNLKQLLVVLGVEPVLQIALLCATEQIFTQEDDEGSLPVTTLWYRSVLCAHIAEEMAAMLGGKSKHEAYLGGLLHRLGQWVLMTNEPEDYLDKIDTTLDLKKTEALEKRLFNTCSSEIGAGIIRHWQVCPFIADAIEFQTRPPEALLDSTELVRILALSRILSEQSEPESAGSIYAASRFFELNNDIVQQIVERARTRTDSIVARFSSGDEAVDYTSAPVWLRESRKLREKELRVEVKNHAMANTVRRHSLEHGDIRITLNQLRRDFCVLFGTEDLGFLLIDKNRSSLRGYDDLGTRAELNQVSIRFDNDISFAMQSFHADQVSCSDEDKADVFSVPERQLENLFASKLLCFIPMSSCGVKKGLIVAPVSTCQWKYLSASRALLRLAGRIFAEALINADVAQKRKKQEQEELQLKLRAAVHEMNNPLSIINNYLYLLSQELETEKGREQIEIIQEEIARVGTLAAGLENVGDEPDRKRGHVQINTLIEKLVELLSGSLFEPRELKLHVDLDSNLEPIASVAGNLKQVFINLLKNAAEALPSKGEVWITTRDRVYKNQRQYVEIEIRDNGPGIDEAVLENLFQPVTSTKENHSGMGLAIVKHLIDEINGEISCSSSNAGTRFQILLPRVLA
jgi:signal transduction histidine kinase/HD-like signal output (HDOD) protein